jgi:hypothetical protein
MYSGYSWSCGLAIPITPPSCQGGERFAGDYARDVKEDSTPWMTHQARRGRAASAPSRKQRLRFEETRFECRPIPVGRSGLLGPDSDSGEFDEARIVWRIHICLASAVGDLTNAISVNALNAAGGDRSGDAFRRDYARPSTSATFRPPNANEFDIAFHLWRDPEAER